MKFQIIHTVDPKIPNTITRYMHCYKCLMEKPPETSPRDWSRLEVGITKDGGVQIWCQRHHCNVTLMTVGEKAK